MNRERTLTFVLFTLLTAGNRIGIESQIVATDERNSIRIKLFFSVAL